MRIRLMAILLLLSMSNRRRGTDRTSHFVSWTHGESEEMMLMGVVMTCCFSMKLQPLGTVMVDVWAMRADIAVPLLHWPRPVYVSGEKMAN